MILFVFFVYECVCLVFFFFFFSSRRRHTRLTCDWSSDVCSSDLAAGVWPPPSAPCRTGPGRGPGAGADRRVVTRWTVPLLRVERRSAHIATGRRSEERRVGKECRSRGSAYH